MKYLRIWRMSHYGKNYQSKAIVAAQNTYSGKKYETVVSGYAKDLLANTEKSKEYWSTRYFAAQTLCRTYGKV